MRRILIPLAVLLLVGFGVQAHAASAISLLDPYEVNYLEDDDYEGGFFADGVNLAVGDVLFGMIVIDPWVQSQTGPNAGPAGRRFVATNEATFTGVFVLEVTARTGTGPYEYTFGPTSAANWVAATDPDGAGAAVGFSPTDSETIIMVYDDDGHPVYIDPTATPVGAALATASDGTLLWELGFDTANRSDLFWTATAQSTVVADIGAISDYLSFRAALDVTFEGAGPLLLPHNYLSAGPFTGIFSDIQITGRNTGTALGAFPVGTDAEIYMVPTPEPASLALLGLGLLGLGGVVYRRRRS